MSQRSKRRVIHTDQALGRLKEGRAGAIQVSTEAKIGSPEYRAAQDVLDAIDALAEKLTGNREHFVKPLARAGIWAGPSR
ncbi:hypothetical protein LAL4801_04152 [Roseibium aggregatum]|uniref:Uncharacterized protein n=1 Tax=Roseibium aggregatum TaxID=187304 RepID=A0A0M6Y8V1_9HYPH|nr:hypothetical protein LAL4801_04152 [Roseibium aggregatum]